MSSRLFSRDHNTYHRRFRDTWLQREKEATRPFTFQPKALEMFENQYKSELLIRSHPRGRGFESLQVHQNENRPKGRFSFCRGPAGVEVYPPCGGNPFRSTKQVLDEHLFLQRRLRREVFALIQNRKAPSWEKSQGGAFSIFLGLVYFLSYAIY